MTDDEDLSDFENKMRALEEAIKRDEEAFYGDRTIKDSKFTTDAYGPIVACGSVITELVKGKTIEEAFGIEIKDIESVLGRLPAENVSSPVLAVNTLKAALEDYTFAVIRIKEKINSTIFPLTVFQFPIGDISGIL
ncbi:MAG: iron-sulfur cluster assembly scaffold protein [Methanophagales archaeon]|nr:iron-sulfur cluster assembly scaffold protein [Methanophagales archaeon]